MFAGVAYSFQQRWAGNDSWILLPDNNTVSLSFQLILTRHEQYDLVQPNIRTDVIGIHRTWNELLRTLEVALFRSPRCDRAEGRALAHHQPGFSTPHLNDILMLPRRSCTVALDSQVPQSVVRSGGVHFTAGYCGQSVTLTHPDCTLQSCSSRTEKDEY